MKALTTRTKSSTSRDKLVYGYFCVLHPTFNGKFLLIVNTWLLLCFLIENMW